MHHPSARATVAARVAACAFLLAGCYRYAPFPAVAAAPGAELRLRLTPEGSGRVASALGPQTTVVAGRAEGGVPNGTAGGASGDAVSLLVSSTTKASGGTVRWVGERVTIPVAAIALSERRVLDRRRTLLAGGGVALAAVAGYALLRAASGGGSDAGGEPPIPTP